MHEIERLERILKSGDSSVAPSLLPLAYRRGDAALLGAAIDAWSVDDEPAASEALSRITAEAAGALLVEATLRMPRALAARLVCGAALGWCPRFRRAPAGSFMMGASSGDDPYTADDDERPVREVTLNHGLFVAHIPVTQAHWRRLMGNNPSYAVDGLVGDAPVNRVCWADAVGYCQELSRMLGVEPAYRLTAIQGTPGVLRAPDWDALRSTFSARVEWPIGPTSGCRLPTEAEWEYVARAGSQAAFHGDPDDIGWFDRNATGRLQRVAQKQPNRWGLHDMLGNIWEWCWDHWEGSYKGCARVDPRGVEESRFRVLRGGGFTGGESSMRVSARNGYPPDACYSSVGFRVVFEDPVSAVSSTRE